MENVNPVVYIKKNQDEEEEVLYLAYHYETNGIEYQGRVTANEEEFDLGIF